MSSSIMFEETDTTGKVLKTYSLTATKESSRLDLIPNPQSRQSTTSTKRSTTYSLSQRFNFVNTHIAPLFLPHGYPHSVTTDYTPYQIYDSLQAFTSAIAGLLSSRAVLQSLGMDSSEGSGSGGSTATYATLLSVARSTISNVSTILFADHMSSRIASEVKYYRFLADILNDTGFLLEMISPSLPEYMKVPILCVSSAMRAMCGVAGGSSKAILSAHFARDGNIGDLNAKDGSQETLISLVGMWVGGVVVSKVEGFVATWCWMLGLLGLHLWFNWCAVSSVRLKGLNMSRAGIVFGGLIRDDKCRGWEDVGRKEKIFDQSGAIRDGNGHLLLIGKMGVGLNEITRLMGSERKVGSGSETVRSDMLAKVVEAFAKEQYLLWWNGNVGKVTVVLKEGASRDDELKAWCHAVRLAHLPRRDLRDDSQVLEMIVETLSINDGAWGEFRSRIEKAGWDMSATVMNSTTGKRLRLLSQ